MRGCRTIGLAEPHRPAVPSARDRWRINGLPGVWGRNPPRHRDSARRNARTARRAVDGKRLGETDFGGLPEVGIEPTPCCQDGILNPARLPIPPLRRLGRVLPGCRRPVGRSGALVGSSATPCSTASAPGDSAQILPPHAVSVKNDQVARTRVASCRRSPQAGVARCGEPAPHRRTATRDTARSPQPAPGRWMYRDPSRPAARKPPAGEKALAGSLLDSVRRAFYASPARRPDPRRPESRGWPIREQ